MLPCLKFRLRLATCIACLVCCCTAASAADQPGQADLDQAVELKPQAVKLAELTKVIDLCRSSIDKGLDDEGAAFARQLLSSALASRARRRCLAIFDRTPPDPRWPKLRQESLEDLDQALEIVPDDGVSHLYRGKLHALQGGDPEQSLQSLGRAIELLPDEFRLLSEAYLARAGLPQRTAEDREADIRKSAELGPENARALAARGQLYYDNGQDDKALADLNKAIELDPAIAEAHLAAARIYVEREDFPAARDALAKAVDLSPNAPELRMLLIDVCEKAGDPAAAIVHVTAALKAAPDDTELLFRRLRLHAENGDGEAAIADVDRLLELQPGNLQTLRTRAVLQGALEHYDEAIADLEKIKREGPSDTGILLQIAIYYAAKGDFAQAIENYSAVIRQEPENTQALRARGDARLALGKPREAIADYEDTVALSPEDVGVLNNLAWVLATSSDDAVRNGARAVDLAAKACELTDYKQAHLLSTLAAAHAEAGDFAKAVEWSTKAVAAGAPEQRDALDKELASYRAGKPWREPPARAEEQP